MVVNSNLQEIKKFDCRRFLQRSKAGLYICPVCRSGERENRTGALQVFEDTNKFKCHACGVHGDVIDLYGLIHGLDAKESIKALSGLITGHRELISENKPIKEKQPAQEPIDFTGLYKTAFNAFLGSPAEEYINSRGISTNTARAFKLGYLKDSRFSGNERQDALIIPCSKNFYICRSLKSEGIRYKNPKGSQITLFNLNVIYNDVSDVIFVCESAIDAISITEIGGLALGLNSVSNINKLLNTLKSVTSKPACLVLCLDNDESGNEGTYKLAKGLKDMAIKYIDGREILFNGFKDVNEALKASRVDFLNNFDKCLQKALQDETPIKEETADENGEKKAYFSIENFEKELEKREISIKLNIITREIDYLSGAMHVDTDDTVTMLFSELYRTHRPVNIAIITDYARYVANKNAYNPVLELIKGTEWDGVDRMGFLYDALHIDEKDTLSRLLILKWFWQGISLLRNDESNPFGADGILVLSGAQGLGKTTFFRHFAIKPEWFGGGRKIKSADKDHERRCVTSWIVELGELDTTFKHADAGALKEFITREMDIYRLPYGRTDRKHARRSNIGATVNGHDFLIDETGNRRYWTVPITRIDLKALVAINPLQVWCQVWEQVAKYDVQGFRLAENERACLEKLNESHTKTIKGEDEILDIIAIAEDKGYIWQMMTVTEFKELYKEILKPYSVRQISLALDKLGILSVRKKEQGKVSRVRELPTMILKSDYEE